MNDLALDALDRCTREETTVALKTPGVYPLRIFPTRDALNMFLFEPNQYGKTGAEYIRSSWPNTLYTLHGLSLTDGRMLGLTVLVAKTKKRTGGSDD